MATYRKIEKKNLKEHGHLWHSDDERRANDEDIKDTIRRLRSLVRKQKKASTSDERNQVLVELNQLTIRGIEQFATRSVWEERRREQLACIKAVVKTNQEQRAATAGAAAEPLANDEDATDLALVAASLSFRARKRAMVQGLQDAEEVCM